MHKQNKVYGKIKYSRNPNLEHKYRELRAKSKQSINGDYKSFITLSENNIQKNVKSFWAYLRSKRTVVGSPNEMNYAGVTSSNPKEIADMFADFFQSVYVAGDCPTLYSVKNLPVTSVNLCKIDVNIDVLFEKLINLDIHKSAGLDKIPPVFLSNCSPTLCLPLSFIYETSLNTGVFPTLWKSAIVTPLFKSDNRSNISNYRPISGLPCIAKVLESLVTDLIFKTFKDVISENQHGFFSGRSCQTNLCIYNNFLATALDAALQVDAIYFDFKKAFDRVDHYILLQKLEYYGIGDPLLSWINSYLRNRIQFVKFKNCLSKKIVVHSGVPQGSHLGPVLFLIFINDLSYVFTECQFLFFADDLKIFRIISNRSDCMLLQNEIAKLLAWCNKNNMILNTTKCKVISFSRKKHLIDTTYAISDSPLPRVTLINDLGVIFDSELRFINQVNNVIARAFKMAGFIMRQCWEFRSVEVLKTMYFALVRSHLEYCSLIWAPLYNIHIKRLERVQSKFVNFLLYKLNIDRSQMTYLERINVMGLNSLEVRRIRLTLIFGHKLLNNLIDCSDLLSLLNFRVPPRTTRKLDQFSLNYSRTDIGRNSPINRMMKYFNTYIPNNFNYNCSVASFRSRIKYFIDDVAI